jgi:hypothetical protein
VLVCAITVLEKVSCDVFYLTTSLTGTAPQLSFAVLGKEEGVEVQPRANYLPPLEKTGDANQPAITRRPRPVDSAKILESLRQEGLLEETSKGVSGVSYEVSQGALTRCMLQFMTASTW